MLDSTQRPSVVVDTSRSPHARLRSLPLTDVRLSDGLWEPRRRVNHKVTLPSQYDLLENTGRLDNFRRASGKIEAPFQGIYFNDSDVYKWLEAASWELASNPDRELEELVDTAVTEIEAAQQPDGYLNTYFMFDKAPERWTNLRDMHEFYCAGHLIQAAVAHHCATGNERLLEVARKLADHICEVFGPEESGKKEGVGGHEEVEMALVELYRDTGETRYLEQARYFIDARGHGFIGGSEYHQDHKPLRDQAEAVGHSVRAVYLCAGAADVYAETGDESILRTLEKLWGNMTSRRMYVSGGIGSRYDEESFGRDFELPNARAYAESCAAIGSVMWNWRMLMLDGDARYADLMEHTLYNAVLPGLSLDGQNYFYQNPLADDGEHRRQPWFGTACCPPNIARLLASIPGYFYSVSEDAVWVHLYAESEAEVSLGEARNIPLKQRTSYPWDGNIEVEVGGEGDFSLMLRIPSWCETDARIEVNGELFGGTVSPGSYAGVRRAWKSGDMVRIALPMPVRRVEAHPHVTENTGRVALMRGPLLYCVEQADNPEIDPRDLVLPAGEDFLDRFFPELLGGVSVLEGRARTDAPDKEWDGRLYRTARTTAGGENGNAVRITAVPYYAWANREPGAMQVWLWAR